MKARTPESLDDAERAMVTGAFAWDLEFLPALVEGQAREGLDGLALPLVSAERLARVPELETVLWLDATWLCGVAWMDPEALSLQGETLRGDVQAFERWILPLAVARAKTNPTFYWVAFQAARSIGAQIPIDVLEYLDTVASHLARPGVFSKRTKRSTRPADVAEALGFKRPGGQAGPADLKRQTKREDAETLLAFLLALRIGEGVKRSAALRDVARYATTSESTVARAGRNAGLRAERMLGAFLALGREYPSKVLRAMRERVQRDGGSWLEASEEAEILSGLGPVSLDAGRLLLQLVVQNLHGHALIPSRLRHLAAADSTFGPNLGSGFH